MTNYNKGDKIILRKGDTVIHGTAHEDGPRYGNHPIHLDGDRSNSYNAIPVSIGFDVEVIPPKPVYVEGMVASITPGYATSVYWMRTADGTWATSWGHTPIRDDSIKPEWIRYDPRRAS